MLYLKSGTQLHQTTSVVLLKKLEALLPIYIPFCQASRHHRRLLI